MKDIPHVHIVGTKKSGKTSLIEFLLEGLLARGYRIGALKHSSHSHALDKTGSDSDRFSKAGANPSAFVTHDGMAVFYRTVSEQDLQKQLPAIFSDCDLVLIESFRQAKGMKILIQDENPISDNVENILAVINEDGYHPDFPAFRHRDTGLIDFICQQVLTK